MLKIRDCSGKGAEMRDKDLPFWTFISAYFKLRAYLHDITAAILMSQNNETAAMLVYQDNPV